MKYFYKNKHFFSDLNNEKQEKQEMQDFDLIMQHLINTSPYKFLLPLDSKDDSFRIYINQKIPYLNKIISKKDKSEIIELDIIIPLIVGKKNLLIIIECKNYSRGIGTKWLQNNNKTNINKLDNKIKFINKFLNKTSNTEIISLLCCILINNEVQIINPKNIKKYCNIIFTKESIKRDIPKEVYNNQFNCNNFFALIDLLKNQDFDNNLFQNHVDILLKEMMSKDKKSNVIKIFGNPGTGKTYLAFMMYVYFLKRQDFEVHFWIINPNIVLLIEQLWKSNNSNEIPNLKNIYFRTLHTRDLIEKVKTQKQKRNILIIDEFQRIGLTTEEKKDKVHLSKEEIKILFKNFDVLLFGDENQRINPSIDNFNLDSIEKDYFKYELSKNIRFGNELEDFLKCIISPKKTLDSKNTFVKIKNLDHDTLSKPNIKNFILNYTFEVTRDINVFVNIYLDNKSKNKIIVAIKENDEVIPLELVKIAEKLKKTILKSPNKEDIENRELLFFDETKSSEFIFSIYDLISHEIESLFLFLPPKFVWEHDNVKFFNNPNEENINYSFGQLWVSLTRAKQNLVIFTCNDETFNYCNEISEIIKKSKTYIINNKLR